MAVDYLLDLQKGGIEGESLEKGFEKCFQLQNWNEGVSNSGSSAAGSGLGVGRAQFSDFSFNITHGKASPKLMLACASGQHISEVTLTCRKSTGEETPQPFLVFKFKDVVISSWNVSGSSEGLPYESISLNFSEVTQQSSEQAKDGKITLGTPLGWNVKENKKAA